VIRDRAGQWVLLAFQNADSDEAFVGGLSDPIPIHWENSPEGRTRLRTAPVQLSRTAQSDRAR
jgi:beta-fructofuranosidase